MLIFSASIILHGMTKFISGEKIMQTPIILSPNFGCVFFHSGYLVIFLVLLISSIPVGITQFFQNCQRKDNLLSLAYLYGKGFNVLSYLEQTELYLCSLLDLFSCLLPDS